MQAPVAELAWTQYVGFLVVLGAIWACAMAVWSWARVCAGHLAALREIAARDQRQRDGQRQRDDQAARELVPLQDGVCGHGPSPGAAGKQVRWDEGEQALTSRPEDQPAARDPETTAAAGTGDKIDGPLCEDGRCLWHGRFPHAQHLPRMP